MYSSVGWREAGIAGWATPSFELWFSVARGKRHFYSSPVRLLLFSLRSRCCRAFSPPSCGGMVPEEVKGEALAVVVVVVIT